MKRLLIVQPSLQPPYGGNGVAVAMIEALKADYALTVLTWFPIELTAINRFYGSTLQPTDFTALTVPSTWRRALGLMPTPASLLMHHLILRYCKRIAGGFDCALTANNEADFGIGGIQYVHFPWAYQPRPRDDLRWYHRGRLPVAVYRDLCRRVSAFSLDGMKRNVTLVNSAWTGAHVRACHGIDSIVLHPALPASAPDVAWAERESGFVCCGRINPQKRIERVIDILAAVRRHGHDVHLHVVGAPDGRRYFDAVRRHAAVHDWVSFHSDLSRAELLRLIARHRYGIHGMTDEHFGLAVADIVQAGGIAFVPNSGGQREVVGADPRLLYDSVDDAVGKIIAVLDCPSSHAALRDALAARREQFSPHQFSQRLRGIVGDVLAAAAVSS